MAQSTQWGHVERGHFNVRSVWLVFIVTIFIAISVLNANSEDPDDTAFCYI